MVKTFVSDRPDQALNISAANSTSDQFFDPTGMRTHRVPSYSTHDGLIVPRSQADLAKDILAREYRRHVGVEPILTVEPEDFYGGALDL
jgi:hypothetical protein